MRSHTSNSHTYVLALLDFHMNYTSIVKLLIWIRIMYQTTVAHIVCVI